MGSITDNGMSAAVDYAKEFDKVDFVICIKAFCKSLAVFVVIVPKVQQDYTKRIPQWKINKLKSEFIQIICE